MDKIIENIKKVGTKKIIIALACMILLTGVIITLGNTLSSSNVQVFNDVKLQNVVVEDIEIKNISIKEETGVYTYKAEVVPNKDINLKYIEIKVNNEANEEIVTLIGYVGDSLKKDKVFNLEASTDADISSLKTIDYKIIK